MPKSAKKIFLDANVMIQEGKHGSPITERLVDLVNAELIEVLTTDLTMTEVAKKHAENDLDVVKDYARPHFRAILNDVLATELPEINNTALKQNLLKKYAESTQRMFTSLRATVLSIDDVRPSDVLGAYSRREGFFSGEGKKDQFPDAFIFACLRKIADSGKPIIIVSADGDFIGPSNSVDNITLVKTFAKLFEALDLEIEMPEVEGFFESENDNLISWFDTEVSNWSLQVADVEDGEIDSSEVTSIKINDYAAFRSTRENGDILVTGNAAVTANVSYTHPDWDTASWDSEDRVAIPRDNVSGETEVEFEVRFSMTLTVDASGAAVALANLSFLDDSFVYINIEPYEIYK